jgi:hypothetical protein
LAKYYNTSIKFNNELTVTLYSISELIELDDSILIGYNGCGDGFIIIN